jgi:indole-3-glycerol phosphate synthase
LDEDLKSLYAEARRMGLDVLCEIHDREELERAVALGFSVIGVNSRNLHTMEVQPQTQIELAELLPRTAVRVAESGIRSASDIARMAEAGFDAFLIGESLMRGPDPGAALAALLEREYSAGG